MFTFGFEKAAVSSDVTTAEKHPLFEKTAKLRGRSLRVLREFLAKNKSFWSHATHQEGLEGALKSGLRPARALARSGDLKKIEGVGQLRPSEVKMIADSGEGAYRKIQLNRNAALVRDNTISHYPVDSVSYLKNAVAAPSNFGPYAIIGKMRQLASDPKKILREEGIKPMSSVAKSSSDGLIPGLKDVAERKRKRAQETTNWLSDRHADRRVSRKIVSTKQPLFRGSSIVEGMTDKSGRGITPRPGQNILLVPKNKVNDFRRRYPNHTFLASEDVKEKFPDLFHEYHKRS